MQIEWSIRKKQNKEEPIKQKLKIRNIISTNVLNMIRIQDLIEYLFIDYPKLKEFQLFMLQYTKKKL